MDTIISSSYDSESGITRITLSNDHCRIVVSPETGGRIVSFVLLSTDEEVLWRNKGLRLFRSMPGDAYDPAFYGGIDELLPCDLPETIDGIEYPDHGELWTTPLQWEAREGRIRLWGRLPRSGLYYEREMTLSSESPEVVMCYRIENQTEATRHFLWKLHAAIMTLPGDKVVCPALTAQAVDLAYSSCTSLEPFSWPDGHGKDKSVIPVENGTCEFLYLSELSSGRMGLERKNSGSCIQYEFDRSVFPYPWLFQSFGGFDGHFVTVLEPCTNRPISVMAAQRAGTCAVLAPGEAICTTVRLQVQSLASAKNKIDK